MKKLLNKGTLSAALVVLALSGCKKNLELQAPFQLTPTNAFSDLASYQRQLSGVYGAFASADYYNGYAGVTTDILTDNCYETTESLVNFNQVHNWQYDAADRQRTFFTSMFLIHYNTILQANTIITGIDAAKAENELFYNRILGQALAARAIAHFDVLKGYADHGDRNSTAPGIPIKTDTKLDFPARKTVKEVYDAIYADLNRAIQLLSNVDAAVNSASNKGFIDVWGARAALSRVALHGKDYPTAIQQSTLIINQFPLANRAQFPGIWNDNNANEQIWNIVNNSGDAGSPFPSAEVMSFRFNRNTFGILPDLIKLYDTTGFGATGTSRDIRFSSYFFLRNTNAANGNNNWGLKKFAGKGNAADNLVNYKVFRVAEQYLIRAEAYALSNQEALGSTDLNNLKAARISNWTNVAYSGSALIAEIANERRRELCFESHRWFDVKRTNKTMNRVLTGTGNANSGVLVSLPANSHRWVWPIPEAEIRANPAMTQNAGY